VLRSYFQVEPVASLSRRAVLVFMSAAGAVVAGGGLLLTSGPESLIRKILFRRFPELRMSEASIMALTSDVMQARFRGLRRRTAVQGGAWVAGIVGIDALAKWEITTESFHHLERQIVTYFILGSDFLDVTDIKRDMVTYAGTPEVCPNRFAEYDG
jgi:hypothetical protein